MSTDPRTQPETELRKANNATTAAVIASVMHAWQAHQAGLFPHREFLKHALGRLVQARAVITLRADVAVARERNEEPLGIQPSDRLRDDYKALVTVTEDPETAPARLDRVIKARMRQAEEDARYTAARRHGARYWRWVRQGSDTCDTCMAEQGHWRTLNYPFEPAHPGCDCSAEYRYTPINWKDKK